MRISARLAVTTAAALLACAASTSLAADGIETKVDSALRKELSNKIAIELARALTDDMFAVANDKHLSVSISFSAR